MCERELGWEAEQSIPGKPAALGGVFKHTGEIVPSSRRASANFCSPCKDFSLGLACVRRPWFSKGLRRCPCLRASLQSLTREHGVNWFLGLCICCLMSTNTHFYFFFLPPYGMLWFQSNTGLQTQTCQSYDCGCIDGEYALLLERLHLSVPCRSTMCCLGAPAVWPHPDLQIACMFYWFQLVFFTLPSANPRALISKIKLKGLRSKKKQTNLNNGKVQKFP